MRAIILAAGVGKRLGQVEGERRPKCLLRPGGESLLARHLRLLETNGVAETTVVTGFRADAVTAEVDSLPLDMPVVARHNPDYEAGSVVSLRMAADVLRAGDEVLVMDADVLYHPAILARLIDAGRSDLFLLDRDFEPGEEPVKLCAAGGRLQEFRKRPAPGNYDIVGESVGFFRLSPATATRLADRTDQYVAERRSDAPHEEAIRDLLLASPGTFDYIDVTGLPWIEIDFPEDLARAQSEILPLIDHASARS